MRIRRAWLVVRRFGPIVVLLALAVAAALVARDAAAVRQSVAHSDLVFLEAQPSYARLWRLDTTIPYPARLFGIEDDLLYRHALRKYAAEDRRQEGRFNFSSPGLRAEAQAALSIAENADLSGLVSHHHGEGTYDVEGSDDHDKKDNQPHRELLQLQSAEEARVLGLPIEGPVGIAQPLLQRLPNQRGPIGIIHPDRDTGDRGTQTSKPLRDGQRHHHKLVVVLKHSRVEQTRDLELPKSGDGNAERGVDLGLGDRHQGHDVTGIHRKPRGEPRA